jgi:hypothetical protein
MRIVTIAALAALLGACHIITGPRSPDVQFAFEPTDEEKDVLAENIGSLLVTGTIRTPCMPYVLNRDVRVASGTVDLFVIGGAVGNCNAEAAGHLEYGAVIALRAASYRVRVYHDWRNHEWQRELVLDTTLSIGF